jgi:hypothetical protein
MNPLSPINVYDSTTATEASPSQTPKSLETIPDVGWVLIVGIVGLCAFAVFQILRRD